MKENKSEQIWLRVEHDQKEELKCEAGKRGLTLSEYVRQLVFRDQAQHFDISLGDYVFFKNLMDSGDYEQACDFIKTIALAAMSESK